MPTAGLVMIVDDDPSVREALSSLVRTVGSDVATYESADEFLAGARRGVASCLVLDVRLPGLSGLEVRTRIAGPSESVPIVFVRCPARTCSTNSSPNRLVNGPERNNKR